MRQTWRASVVTSRASAIILMAAIPCAEASSTPAARCVNNLRWIDGSKQLCALAMGLSEGAEVTQDDLMRHVKYESYLTCPESGPVGETGR